jgi:hypothetical protein
MRDLREGMRGERTLAQLQLPFTHADDGPQSAFPLHGEPAVFA